MSRSIKRRKFTKAKCQTMHAKAAFWTRYHIKYNKAVKVEMISTILTGEYELLDQQTGRCAKIKFKYRDQDVIVIWDCHRMNIVTCLLESGYVRPARKYYERPGGTFY